MVRAWARVVQPAAQLEGSQRRSLRAPAAQFEGSQRRSLRAASGAVRVWARVVQPAALVSDHSKGEGYLAQLRGLPVPTQSSLRL